MRAGSGRVHGMKVFIREVVLKVKCWHAVCIVGQLNWLTKDTRQNNLGFYVFCG